ncbi:LytR/AlgR family response regulator transcription factor [Spirosoma rhododendri]|uniref:Response regulator transcription factor n=1 Tax=Spirosoma rhododendri TaxID=2728024 RepID=A0A7L5DGF6_9BACT|nr:LytTR family DNA-binding domain-containing protein [Spirosoma rhododendri]QJD77326.1 response regulator transcription factor [Spirosoma rhododendri]
MIRAIAIDDEPPALRIITHFCNLTESIDLLHTFTRTDEAMQFLEQHPVDLLFLDINMPAMTGIEFYQAIPNRAMVIFTTAYAEYAVTGFDLSAVDYLLKPFTLDRFRQAVDKAAEQLRWQSTPDEPSASPERFLHVRADYKLYQIALSDILYVEGLDDYLKIHVQTGHPIVARMTMKAMQQKLPDTDFIRVHRSFIVPFRRIESVRNKVIQLAGQSIPIGASYEADFFERFG